MQEVKYLLYTNMFYRYPKFQNSNPYRVFHARSREEAVYLEGVINMAGFSVTKVTTRLGTPVTL